MTVHWHLKHPVHGDQPRAVQAEAMQRADGRARYGQFLEQGLGKTALAMNEFIDAGDVDLNIVIAPQSFKLDWALAPDEWGLGFLRAGVWPRDLLPFDWECGQYALNYEAISRSHAKAPLLELFEKRRCMLTIDESKAIGNPQSGWTRAVIELAKRAKMVRELNGTPLTQSPMDYYGQLRVLGELNGVNPVSFRNRYAVLGGFMGRQIMSEVKNGDELAGILDRCSFRALKSDWLKDLPPKTYTPVHLEMTDRQRQHYGTMMEEFYALVNDDAVTAEMIVTQMGKLRQISSGILIDGDKVHVFEPAATNPKVKAAIEIAEGPGKSIVVHHHRACGKLLIDEFQRKKLNPAYIQGGMKPAEIIEQKRRFNDDKDCRVLIGQERATALGHTLVGQPNDRCDKTIFFENSFSLYYRSQVEDRNHGRDALNTKCTCLDLITTPMDQTVVNSLVAKREMASSMDTIVSAVRQEHDRRKTR